MEQPGRIAIYGGTFDPVHLGHLAIARRVSQIFHIPQFLFLPARVAPHKFDRQVSSGFHRYAMLALATQQDELLRVSRFELDGPERQYTVDTLNHFRKRFGEAVELFFVMGADSWSEITTWREWQRLMTLANLIVVTRPGVEFGQTLPATASANIVDLRGTSADLEMTQTSFETRHVFITDAVMLDISATNVRKAAASGDYQSLAKLVPIEVGNYIRKYGLYRNTNEA